MRIEGHMLDLLMELQFSFPLKPRPFREIAERLGVDEEWVLKITRGLISRGVIRRIGAVLNYRSRRQVAALVAFAIQDDMDEVIRLINSNKNVTHNFERNHERYNVWFVVRGSSEEEILSWVEGIARAFKIDDYIVQFSVRAFKLDVKFDLRLGISKSKLRILPERIPTIDELDIPIEFFQFVRSIDVVEEPFEKASRVLGIDQERVCRLIADLIERGVLRDFYAALDPYSIGFDINAMVAVKADHEKCLEIARFEETTHVVHRVTVRGNWPYNCYFVIHGRDRRIVEDAIDNIMHKIGVSRYEVLYSVRNLLPEMGRRLEEV